jgi:4-hydroxybenzoate polyprenyltransferase
VGPDQNQIAVDAGLRRRAGAILRLIRVENCVVAYMVTLIGAASAGPGRATDRHGLVGGVIVALVVAFGNVVNDIFDTEVDRRSKAWRPLPAGIVSRGRATVTAAVLALGALALTIAGAGERRFWALVAVMVILAFVYSYSLERRPAIGNLAVAVQVGAVFLFGALGAGSASRLTIAGTVLIGCHSLAMELAKTMEDERADGQVGARTIAHVVSGRGQRHLVLAVLAISAVVTIAFGIALRPPIGYWLVLAPAVPLAAMCFVIADDATSRAVQVGRYVRASKALWFVGLTGLLLAAR